MKRFAPLSHEEVTAAVADFLAHGGTITKLPDEITPRSWSALFYTDSTHPGKHYELPFGVTSDDLHAPSTNPALEAM